jgi:hypothetical protein
MTFKSSRSRPSNLSSRITFSGALLLTILTTAIPLHAEVAPASNLIVYPAPEGSRLNPDFTVKVRTPDGNWQDVASYLVNVDEVTATDHSIRKSSMAYFDFSGSVDISVTYHGGAIQKARVRPLSYGITPEVKDETIAFSLTKPRNLSVEVNGDIFGNLQLFANPIETSRPDPGSANVIYFAPGIHIIPDGTLRVPSNKTVYLAGGGIVVGNILCDDVENVLITGRGMIDQGGGGLRIANSRNIKVSGIFGRQFFTGGSQNVTIENVKCISSGRWGDGMDVICGQDVLIDGVFNRNSDDCIAIYAARQKFFGGSARITVRNSTLWADVAHPVLVGTHGNTPKPETIEDLAFSNIDILDHMEAQIDYQGCMSLNAGDSNLIRNVTFEDIRVEDFRKGQLVNLRVFYNRKYCTSAGRGIENVIFKNISYTGTHAEQSIMAGYDDARQIKNVTFENLTINGLAISDRMKKPGWFKTSDMARFFVGEHVEGLKFISDNR